MKRMSMQVRFAGKSLGSGGFAVLVENPPVLLSLWHSTTGFGESKEVA